MGMASSPLMRMIDMAPSCAAVEMAAIVSDPSLFCVFLLYHISFCSAPAFALPHAGLRGIVSVEQRRKEER